MNQINPNEPILNGPRIDSDLKLTSDWIGIKLFGADTKFRIDSENFGLVRNEFQSETFARDMIDEFFKFLGLTTVGESITVEHVWPW